MKIILTGASGLIGSRFEELMFENHKIIPLSAEKCDIVNKDSVRNFFDGENADVVLHLAAKTDVDGCEQDKDHDLSLIMKNSGDIEAEEFKNTSWKLEDWAGNPSAFAVNFLGTRNLYSEAKERGIKFMYISTDFVFNGNDDYDEESVPDPVNWYGMTKWYGERVIDNSKDLTVRLSFPYGYPSPVKQDFVQKIISLLRDRDEVSLIEDQIITPTFIDDIVKGFDFIIQQEATGIYHLTGSSYLDPYEIGCRLKEIYGFKTKINATTREQIYKDKAARPYKSVMKNDKIRKLGFIPKTFDEGLALIKTK